MSRNSKIGGGSPADGQSPETAREISEASEAKEGCKWPSTPKDTIRPQSENVLKEDLTTDHILLCAKVPKISRRTVEIIKGF